MADDVKLYSIPYHYDASALQEASQDTSIRANYVAMMDAWRKREEAAMAERLSDQARDFIQSLGDAPERIDPRRAFETTNADGEKVLFMMREPEDLMVRMPVSFDLPKADAPLKFTIGQRFGGMQIRWPMRGVITSGLHEPVPAGPDVEAMLADGWVWTGLRFARDQQPIERRWPGRFAGAVSTSLVNEGRYADRLPTNRKRKRERAKARRHARRQNNPGTTWSASSVSTDSPPS